MRNVQQDRAGSGGVPWGQARPLVDGDTRGERSLRLARWGSGERGSLPGRNPSAMSLVRVSGHESPDLPARLWRFGRQAGDATAKRCHGAARLNAGLHHPQGVSNRGRHAPFGKWVLDVVQNTSCSQRPNNPQAHVCSTPAVAANPRQPTEARQRKADAHKTDFKRHKNGLG